MRSLLKRYLRSSECKASNQSQDMFFPDPLLHFLKNFKSVHRNSSKCILSGGGMCEKISNSFVNSLFMFCCGCIWMYFIRSCDTCCRLYW